MTEDSFIDYEVRSLSVKQPYASLMLPPVLKVETRSWYTHYRGWVLICVSQQRYLPWQMIDISGREQLERMDVILDGRQADLDRMQGMAIGIGRLVDCSLMRPEDEHSCFVRYKPDTYCHIMRDVSPIIPFGFSGSTGYRLIDEYWKRKIVISSQYHNPLSL